MSYWKRYEVLLGPNTSKIQIYIEIFRAKTASLQFSSVAQSCPTLCDPMDCSLPGSFLHGILQARVLEWVAIAAVIQHFILHQRKKVASGVCFGIECVT